MGAGGEARAGDAHGEREPSAQGDDLGGLGGLVHGAGRSGHPRQQVQRLGGGRDVQVEVGGALQRDEPAAAGDQGRRAAARGQQGRSRASLTALSRISRTRRRAMWVR